MSPQNSSRAQYSNYASVTAIPMISKRRRRRPTKNPSSATAQARSEADQAKAPPSPALDRLFGQVKFFSEFRDFDRHMSATRARLPERKDGNQSVEIAWRLFELGRDHFFVFRVIGQLSESVGGSWPPKPTATQRSF